MNTAFRAAFGQLATFAAASLEATLKAVAAELGVKACVLIHPTGLSALATPTARASTTSLKS